MTLEEAEELYKQGEITLSQKLSIQSSKNTQVTNTVVPTNRGYSVEYWKQHIDYAILGKLKAHDDTSNVEWTQRIYKGLISEDIKLLHGFKGLNGAIAFMEFIKENAYENYTIAIRTLKEYAEQENHQQQVEYANSLLLQLNN